MKGAIQALCENYRKVTIYTSRFQYSGVVSDITLYDDSLILTNVESIETKWDRDFEKKYDIERVSDILIPYSEIKSIEGILDSKYKDHDW